jgi:hypothetical protein
MSMPLSGMAALEQTARLMRSANIIAKSGENFCRHDTIQEEAALISTSHCRARQLRASRAQHHQKDRINKALLVSQRYGPLHYARLMLLT